MINRFGKTILYVQNIFWEPSLTFKEKALFLEIQYKVRLPKEACTESNSTLGLRLSLRPDEINKLLRSLDDKGWIDRIKDYREVTQRRIELTQKAFALIQKPFINWYLERVGEYAYPPMKKEQLEVIVGRKELEINLPILIQKGWVKD